MGILLWSTLHCNFYNCRLPSVVSLWYMQVPSRATCRLSIYKCPTKLQREGMREWQPTSRLDTKQPILLSCVGYRWELGWVFEKWWGFMFDRREKTLTEWYVDISWQRFALRVLSLSKESSLICWGWQSSHDDPGKVANKNKLKPTQGANDISEFWKIICAGSVHSGNWGANTLIYVKFSWAKIIILWKKK
jgi:hypothetical protein